jgi:hypothetical protein
VPQRMRRTALSLVGVAMVLRPRSVSAPMSDGLIPAAIIAAVIAPADEPAAPENHRPLFRTASSAPAYKTPLAPPPSKTPWT